MPDLLVITHAEVAVDPMRPITDWQLSETGRRRVADLSTSEVVAFVTVIWSSAERKARETAAILAKARGMTAAIDPDLGENDRSATGYLPPEQFEAAADAFFGRPDESYRGWERASDAQARIATAVRRITAGHTGGDLAIVTHGAVGTLLWCAMMNQPIDRRFDQSHQGHYWRADVETLKPRHGWIPIA